MQNVLIKKTAMAAAIAAVVLAVTAAAAFAAPVLQPGTTSAPGMSGTCTDCHTYATTSAAPKAKPVKVSHPYMAKGKRHSAKTFKVWGYVSPKMPKSTQATTVTITVQQYVNHSWVSTDGVTATATISAKGKFRNKTNYVAKMTLGQTGRYRIRATLVWKDAAGATHTKRSSYYYLRVYK